MFRSIMVIVLIGLTCPIKADTPLSLGVGRGWPLLIDADGITTPLPSSTRLSIGITFPIESGFSLTLLPGVNVPDAGINETRPRIGLGLGFALDKNWWLSPSVLYEFIPNTDSHFLAVGATLGLKVADFLSVTFTTGPGKLLGLGTTPLPADSGWSWIFQPGLSIRLPAFW